MRPLRCKVIVIKEVKEWLNTLSPGSSLAVDDGGLALVELDEEGTLTGSYLEVGGTPQEDDES